MMEMFAAARTFGVGVFMVTGALGCTVAALYVYISHSPVARLGFSKGPMGIRSSKKHPRRAHAIATVGEAASKEFVLPLWATKLYGPHVQEYSCQPS